MRSIILGVALTLISCMHNTNQQTIVKQIDNIDRNGTYEYVYPDNTPDLIENHFIILSKIDTQLTGLYYGTSDEFDDAREGYLPGFFVSKLNNLEISGDTIRFTLNVDNSDFVIKAVNLKIKSTNDAIKAGYKNWDNKIPTSPKKYQGLFQDAHTIFFKEKHDYLNKTFKKKQ